MKWIKENLTLCKKLNCLKLVKFLESRLNKINYDNNCS